MTQKVRQVESEMLSILRLAETTHDLHSGLLTCKRTRQVLANIELKPLDRRLALAKQYEAYSTVRHCLKRLGRDVEALTVKGITAAIAKAWGDIG